LRIRIPKKWKWAGDLFVDIGEEGAQRLCEITISDVTDYLGEGLRLHILLGNMDSIRFRGLHDVSDLVTLLRASKPSEQVARLGPKSEEDAPVMKGLAAYMLKKKKVIWCRKFSLLDRLILF
jgi:hypothetical protein